MSGGRSWSENMIELRVVDDEEIVKLRFEHSLISMSKWESEYKIPFQGRMAKTPDQMVDYFRDMLISDHDPDLVYRLSPVQQEELTHYINQTRTASSVPQEKSNGIGETMTAEMIYYWMVELNIPFEPTNSWHLSQCLMLIQLTAFKKAPPKKRRPDQVMRDWRKDNENNKRILGIKD